MDKLELLEAVERYLAGNMSAEERHAFEELRRVKPEVDQLVVEHSILLDRFEAYGHTRNFSSTLHDIHNTLVEKGEITSMQPKAMIVQLWKKHRRVMAVAASIAGITTMLIAGMVSYYSRKVNTEQLQQLSKQFENTERKVNALKQQVESDKDNEAKAPSNTPIKFGGTGFLIDHKGYLATNAHVVKDANTVVVQNSKGQEFRASAIHLDDKNDIAILKIDDADFKTSGPLPYSLKKQGAELGEPLFTLGYPREEIVYNEGYMSARTGFNGDTLTCQIGVTANPGNSGGPVFNKNGEIIGIINTRQTKADGVVFAVHANSIFVAVDSVQQDSTMNSIKLPLNSSLKGIDRVQQVRRISEFVYMVKSY